MARGVNGIGIAVATTGGILMYAGFRNITPLAALKAVTSGKLTPLATKPPADFSSAKPEHEAHRPADTPTVEGKASKESLIAFGRTLQSEGHTVTEHPSFGKVGTHAVNSKHYVGKAIDVNHGAGTSKAEQDALNPIAPRARALGYRVIWLTSGHYNHMHIEVA